MRLPSRVVHVPVTAGLLPDTWPQLNMCLASPFRVHDLQCAGRPVRHPHGLGLSSYINRSSSVMTSFSTEMAVGIAERLTSHD